VLLFKAAGAADSAMFTGDKSRLIESLRHVKTFFIINGVMMLLIVAFVWLRILSGWHGGLYGYVVMPAGDQLFSKSYMFCQFLCPL